MNGSVRDLPFAQLHTELGFSFEYNELWIKKINKFAARWKPPRVWSKCMRWVILDRNYFHFSMQLKMELSATMRKFCSCNTTNFVAKDCSVVQQQLIDSFFGWSNDLIDFIWFCLYWLGVSWADGARLYVNSTYLMCFARAYDYILIRWGSDGINHDRVAHYYGLIRYSVRFSEF